MNYKTLLALIITQLMLFYKAVTTKNAVTEIVCVVLIAALSPQMVSFMLRIGKDGLEFIKKKAMKVNET